MVNMVTSSKYRSSVKNLQYNSDANITSWEDNYVDYNELVNNNNEVYAEDNSKYLTNIFKSKNSLLTLRENILTDISGNDDVIIKEVRILNKLQKELTKLERYNKNLDSIDDASSELYSDKQELYSINAVFIFFQVLGLFIISGAGYYVSKK
tara:strand:+ start:68 stop:523 length:456 start_codon:yes stop_codon:yes gene_type:complete